MKTQTGGGGFAGQGQTRVGHTVQTDDFPHVDDGYGVCMGDGGLKDEKGELEMMEPVIGTSALRGSIEGLSKGVVVIVGVVDCGVGKRLAHTLRLALIGTVLAVRFCLRRAFPAVCFSHRLIAYSSFPLLA